MRTAAAAIFMGCVLLSHMSESHRPAFVVTSSLSKKTSSERRTQCKMAKSKKKKSPGGVPTAGIKGFGGSSSRSQKKQDVTTMDRSRPALAFYDYMERNQAGDNLKRAALGFVTLPNGMSLRGVVALQNFKPGDVLIRIPYDVSLNLGPEGEDPSLPAVTLLREYCQACNDDSKSNRKPYFEMLPPFDGEDCMGSTDFFGDEALEALQAPTVAEETLQRRQRTKARFQRDILGDAAFPPWIDGTPVTEEHLRWAVWLITSRVLTVQGEEGEGRSYRLLIPFLDMCNHDRASPHVLTGRVGGELKVVAGAPVQQGEVINIGYGGGVAGNDRFLQDYGFLDAPAVAYELVAQQLLGKRRVMEGRSISAADREKSLEALRKTTMEQDEALLVKETDRALRSAIEYRVGLKKALSKFIEMQ